MDTPQIERRKPGRPKGSSDKGGRKRNPNSLANLKPKQPENPDWADVSLPILLPRAMLKQWRAMTPKQRGQLIAQLLDG